MSIDLDFLVPYAIQYIGGQATLPPGNLMPSLTAAQLNLSTFQPPSAPVVDSERNQWEVVSASGYFLNPTSALGAKEVTLYKGTMAFNTNQGGFSESVYSSVANETALTMQAKMNTILTARCALSNTNASVFGGTTNPIIPQFIRVEDTVVQRDAIPFSEQGLRWGFSNYIPPGGAQSVQNPLWQNIDLNMGWRIAYRSGSPRQIATQCLHGVPINAFNITSYFVMDTAFFREARPNGAWLGKLAQYIQALNTAKLGFRVITGAWNNANGSPGSYSTPDLVYYNPQQQMIELSWKNAPPAWPTTSPQIISQMPANWPNVGSQCRLQVRRWKGFQVLNGRWAAEVIPATTGYLFALRIIRTCRQPTVDTMPKVSPIAWSVWYPGQAYNGESSINLTPDQLVLSGSLVFVEAKKLGRNFEEQRGRARNRPT